MEKDKKSIQFFNYLEEIRKARKISQEDFINDIVSMRQYRRYLKGESSISHDVLESLCERLNVKLEYAFFEFQFKKSNETEVIIALYNNVVSENLDKALFLLANIDEKKIVEPSNALIFTHSKNLLAYYKKQINKTQLLYLTESLININDLLTNNIFNDAELLILISFFQFKNYPKSKIIADKLISYLKKETRIITGHNFKTIVLVLHQLSKYYGSIGEFDKSLEASKTAIKHNLKISSFYLMSSLYFFTAITYHKKNDIKNYELALYNCYISLQLENNKISKEKLIKQINNLFDIDFKKFIIKYINNNPI